MVCRVWHDLANDVSLWRRFCTLPKWQLSRSGEQKQLIQHMLPNGNIHVSHSFTNHRGMFVPKECYVHLGCFVVSESVCSREQVLAFLDTVDNPSPFTAFSVISLTRLLVSISSGRRCSRSAFACGTTGCVAAATCARLRVTHRACRVCSSTTRASSAAPPTKRSR